MSTSAEVRAVPDVRKTVVVDVGVEQAWRVFVEQPLDWWPAHHVFVEDRRSLTIEPHVDGYYYEEGRDGTRVDWGRIVEFDAPRRLVMTWRMGANWRPVLDDEAASLIIVEITELGPDRSEVALTHARLDRHGDAAPTIHAALDGPSPGATLAQYAEVVARATGGTS